MSAVQRFLRPCRLTAADILAKHAGPIWTERWGHIRKQVIFCMYAYPYLLSFTCISDYTLTMLEHRIHQSLVERIDPRTFLFNAVNFTYISIYTIGFLQFPFAKSTHNNNFAGPRLTETFFLEFPHPNHFSHPQPRTANIQTPTSIFGIICNSKLRPLLNSFTHLNSFTEMLIRLSPHTHTKPHTYTHIYISTSTPTQNRIQASLSSYTPSHSLFYTHEDPHHRPLSSPIHHLFAFPKFLLLHELRFHQSAAIINCKVERMHLPFSQWIISYYKQPNTFHIQILQ